MGWLVVTPQPLYLRDRDTMPMVQEAGWAQGPVWTVEENLATIGIRSADLPAHSESLFRLRCPLTLPIPKRSQVARQVCIRFCEVELIFWYENCDVLPVMQSVTMLFLRMRIWSNYSFSFSEIRLRPALTCRRTALDRGPHFAYRCCMSFMWNIWSVSCTYYV
jgi:hypothetical protein